MLFPYTDTVFEPIDEYKGDLARVYFYFGTRYLGEDQGWPGGPATEGAALRPWALELYRAWHEADPVSRKEIDRNNAIHGIQGNRNPFVDRPGWVEEIHGTSALDPGRPAGERPFRFDPGAYPNPFNPGTTIRYTLDRPLAVELSVYNLQGRQVRTLVRGPQGPGEHSVAFQAGELASGVYLVVLKAGGQSRTQKVLLLK